MRKEKANSEEDYPFSTLGKPVEEPKNIFKGEVKNVEEPVSENKETQEAQENTKAKKGKGNKDKEYDPLDIIGQVLVFVDAEDLFEKSFEKASVTGRDIQTMTLYFFFIKCLEFRKLNPRVILSFFFDSEISYRSERFSWYKPRIHARTEEENKIYSLLKYKVLHQMNFQIFCEEGYEACDLISVYCVKNKPYAEIIVISENHNAFTASRPGVHFYSPSEERMFVKKRIKNFIGIEPEDYTIFKALLNVKNASPTPLDIEDITKEKAAKIIEGHLPFPKGIPGVILSECLDCFMFPFYHPVRRINAYRIRRYKAMEEWIKGVFEEYNIRMLLEEEDFEDYSKNFDLIRNEGENKK